MAQKLDNKDLVTFKELLKANSIQVDALAQLLIEKGLITREEFFAKLKEIQSEYDFRKAKGQPSDRENCLRGTDRGGQGWP
jgi:hypothetical protein